MSCNCRLTTIGSKAQVVQPPLFWHGVGPLADCVGPVGALFHVGMGALFHVGMGALFHVGMGALFHVALLLLDCVGPMVALLAGPVAAGSTCVGAVQGSGSSPSKSVSGVSHTWACAEPGSRDRARIAVLGMATVT